ncbi:MAG: hypothetical protein LBS55_06685 [Prevotellaceae bacterium]|jgi:hypothetical protein|nr:hypothetical protein [Prevotellaceae bacterium]
MRKVKLLFLLLIVAAIYNCSEEKKTFFIGNVKVISFEKQRSVSGEHLNIDSIGVNGVDVLDKYLIVSLYGDPYLTQIYDLKTLDLIGKFLLKGQGPNDFGYISIIKTAYPYFWVQDRVYENIRLINVEEIIADKQSTAKKVLHYDNIVEPFNAFYVNDTCLLIKSFDVNKGLYYFYYNPGNGVRSHEVTMYNYPVTSDILYSKMIPLADGMKPDGNKIISISGVLDQIDILDMHHPEKSISVTTTNSQYDYEYIKNTHSEEMKTFYFSYPYCSDRLIFALYENNDTKDLNNIELHIIDWEGNPIYKLLLEQKIEIFSIDLNNGFMYGINKVEERLYRYDIKDILESYEKS